MRKILVWNVEECPVGVGNPKQDGLTTISPCPGGFTFTNNSAWDYDDALSFFFVGGFGWKQFASISILEFTSNFDDPAQNFCVPPSMCFSISQHGQRRRGQWHHMWDGINMQMTWLYISMDNHDIAGISWWGSYYAGGIILASLLKMVALSLFIFLWMRNL